MSLQERIERLFKENPTIKNADLARAIKVSRATITDWRLGKTKTINGANAFALANYFKVNAEWLQTGKGEMKQMEKKGLYVVGRPIELTDKETQLIYSFRMLTHDQQYSLVKHIEETTEKNKQIFNELKDRLKT